MKTFIKVIFVYVAIAMLAKLIAFCVTGDTVFMLWAIFQVGLINLFFKIFGE